jgi:predicted metal-dependent enzyme (double-stranded beta helix superfamily)
MTTQADYTLSQLVADLDRITREETSGEVIARKVAPLVGELVKHPESIPERFRGRGPGGDRGRWILHRAPTFVVTSVVWRPGDRAGAHNHHTWGVIGVVDNQIEETRYAARAPGGAARPLEVRSVTRYGAGDVSCLIPDSDEIHAMHNPTDRDTLEIHIYGKDLYGLPRETWDAQGHEKPLVSPKYFNC